METTTDTILQEIGRRLTGSQSELGFGSLPRRRTIFVNRAHGGRWYFWDGEEPINIEEEALTCTVEHIDFLEKESQYGDSWKTRLAVNAGDESYTLESGYETTFSKGLLLALDQLTDEQLERPITIAPEAGTENDRVLFCNVYADGDRMMPEWPSGDFNWAELAERLRDRINGEEAEDLPEAEETEDLSGPQQADVRQTEPQQTETQPEEDRQAAPQKDRSRRPLPPGVGTLS